MEPIEISCMSKETIERRLDEISNMLYDEYSESEGWLYRGYAQERMMLFHVAKRLLLKTLEEQQ